MPEPYPSDSTSVVSCCVHLRTKFRQATPDGKPLPPGHIPVSTLATYWCEQTCASFGPDDRPGTPEDCQPGRACFEAAS